MARRSATIFINGKEVANEIKAIAREKRKLNAVIQNTVRGSEEYEASVREYARLNGILSEHRQRLRGIESSWDKMRAGAGKFIGFAAAAFTADAIISYGKEVLKTGAAVEILGKKAQIVFGQALPIVTQQAKENAAAMGLTTGAYVDAATAIGDLLIPMGFQREEAANIATNLTNLSGALSEWTGGQFSAAEVSTKLSKALLGEREELKALGIAISEADVKARLMEKGMDKLTGKALEQAKAMVTLELITEKSTDAQTAFAENSGTLIRRQAELSAKFEEVKAKLAQVLLPIFERLFSIIEGGVNQIHRFASAISDLVGTNNTASQSVANLQAQFNIEIETLKRGNLSTENRAKLIEQINTKYKSYLPSLITEKDSLEKITAAQNAANAAFTKKITLLAAEEKFVAVQQKLLDAKSKELELELKLSEAQAKVQETGVGSGQRALNTTSGIDSQLAQAKGVLQDTENAIEQNKERQQELQQEFEKTKAAAIELGVSLDELTGTNASGSSGGGIVNQVVGDGDQAADNLQEKLDRLKEITAQFQEEERLSQLEEDQRKIEELRASYQEQIDLAAELEKSKNETIAAEATEQKLALIQLQEVAVSELEEQLWQERLAREKEREELAWEEEQERAAQFIQEKLEAEKTINEQIAEATLSDMQLEIDALDAHYARLLALAEQYGLDVTKLKDAQEKQLQEITDKYDKQEEQKLIASQQRRLRAQAQMFTELGNLVTSTLTLIGQEESEHAEFQKLITLAQIAFDTASAISSLTAASEANPTNAVTFGAAGAAQFIAGLTRILTNIGKAKQLLTQEVPQRKEGSWFNVRGQDDKKVYNAQYIGSPSTGMLPNFPVVLASEVGPEYFVSHSDLQNPYILNHVRAIENLRGTRQFVEGGATTPLPEKQVTVDDELARATLAVLQELSVSIRNIEAVIPDDTVVAAKRRLQEIEAAAGGSFL